MTNRTTASTTDSPGDSPSPSTAPGTPGGTTEPAMSWAPHQESADAVARHLDVDPARGLDAAQLAARLAEHGRNEIERAARRPAVLRFLDQFRSLLILVLIGAAVLAGVVGDVKDTIVIGVVLLLNATIGFVQENRAERSLDALREMLSPTARVRREGDARIVAATELVPGDVVVLEAGDRVPADGRLVVAESLEVDESALTGESQPVSKQVEAVRPADGDEVPLADRTDMAYMNTTVTRGRADLVVCATGMRTEVGQIAGMLQSAQEPKTPLQVQLDAVGRRITVLGGVAVGVYAAISLARGESFGDLALSAVALAVATVPEGLPAVLALTLALGVQRMARRGAIVKRLASVETLGAATVVCSDKTGTLTLNQMTALQLIAGGRTVEVEGEGYHPVGRLTDRLTGRPATDLEQVLVPLALCGDAVVTADGDRAQLIGDPTEGALVVLAAKGGIDVAALRAAHPRLGEVPFDAARKWMATAHADDTGDTGGVRVHVKGAPDVLLRLSTSVLTEHGVRALDERAHAELTGDIAGMARRGLRVLGVATMRLDDLDGPDGVAADLEGRVRDLTLLGLVGIADPPRPEAREAVALCARAGIAVKMITGDHRDTAAAIAADLGIPGEVVTGADVDRMAAGELAERIDRIGVFARVAPEHKVEIVRALTDRGEIVAMTGDGVNDAAALRSAHMGVAMGLTGTEVTKEAGDMILTDDNFATIVRAVREGRSIFDNVVKFVRFQLSTNIGAILSFLGASIAGLPSPLTALQILWVNIIMDGPPAMALGVDPARPDLMTQPPRRRDERILGARRLGRMFRAGAVMAIGTLGVIAAATDRWGEAVALTMGFTTFVFFQFFNALNARSEDRTVFTAHLFRNRWLWGSFTVVIALQVLIVHWAPAEAIFDTVALSPIQWVVCAAVAASVLAVEELAKLLRLLTGRRAGATTR
jgi:Ca2+-transporting ATPase